MTLGPSGGTLQTRFHDRLERDPEGRALAFYKAGRPIEWISFAEFYAEAAAVAGSLAKRGLKQGDVGMIVLPSGRQSATLLMGALLLGARPLLIAPPALLGMNSDLPRVIAHALDLTKASLVVLPATADRDVFASMSLTDTTLAYADDDFTGGATDAPIAADVAPGDVGALQLTSGTTGLPKICVWTQEAILAAIDGMAAAMELSPSDICFNWTPLYHDMGLVNNFLTCMSAGIPLVMMSPHDFIKRPSDWLRGLHETEATVTWAPNFGFALVTERTDPAVMADVRLDRVHGFWNAAERIHARTYADFASAFAGVGVRPESLKTNFGCAENIGGATFTPPGETYRVEHIDRERFLKELTAVVVPEDTEDAMAVVGAGKGHPGLEVAILDDAGARLPDGKVGAVALRTPSRLTEYLGNAEATAQAIVGMWLLTGDQGYLRDGELFWVGRTHERITVRGKKIDPSDFEPVLFDVPGLRQGCFAAFGIDDQVAGTESVVIVSEVRDLGTTDLQATADQVRRQVLTRLGIGLGDVVLVPPGSLTKTSSGKRRHRHFKQMYESGRLVTGQEASVS